MTKNIGRRAVIRGSLGLIGAGLAGVLVGPGTAKAAVRDGNTSPHLAASSDQVPTSANGWPIIRPEDHAWAPPWRVGGSDVMVNLRLGEPATILLYVLGRFHYEIDELKAAESQVIGYRPLGSASASSPAGNHASGTAVSIRPDWYPAGSRGNFFTHQAVVLRDVLLECEGVVRWGGDDDRPDESRFSIDVPPGDERLHRVAAKIRAWNGEPGQGAGAAQSPFDTERRKAARKLQLQQTRD
ncbi:hypothetical protein [Nonomuraea gerenzanensis]|uniref:hypothetical protein n=1 Tax=Nonomuraea gerenzanensis TaxID=93944 RepID=UPI001CD95C94|nr:hypothetical protein [Nonomuraea gerenzanensis]UBU12572.1 hypothetical protein LCN96_51315 [Nonomuraea gerenzanensis]